MTLSANDTPGSPAAVHHNNYLHPLPLAAAWFDSLPRGGGGFAEAVDGSWRETGGTKRTMLCQSRLAYVFLHAGILGDSRLAAGGRAAIDAMRRHFWKPEARGWLRAIDAEGRPVDDRVESYDQAFGLLSLAWAFRATGDESLRANALEALGGLEASARARGLNFEGYPEWRPAATIEAAGGSPATAPADLHVPRRQNPHMHLLEAFLAWQAVDRSGPWLEKAGAMVDLARRRFIQADGSLCEFFDDSLAPAAGEAGRRREPGHHFEWVWLLRKWHEASGDARAVDDAGRLYRFACTSGRDTDGLAFDAVGPKGNIVEDSKLLWPQTEMLKAHAAWFEWTGSEESRVAARRAMDLIRDNYLLPGGAIWHNQLARNLSPLSLPTPSRVLYHLFLALVESERVFGPAEHP